MFGTIAKLFGRKSPKAPKPAAKFKPTLDTLEARENPSGSYFSSAAFTDWISSRNAQDAATAATFQSRLPTHGSRGAAADGGLSNGLLALQLQKKYERGLGLGYQVSPAAHYRANDQLQLSVRRAAAEQQARSAYQTRTDIWQANYGGQGAVNTVNANLSLLQGRTNLYGLNTNLNGAYQSGFMRDLMGTGRGSWAQSGTGFGGYFSPYVG